MTDPIDLNARRDERVPEPEGEPAITMPMDSDQIMFRDQAALDDYVAGAHAALRAELDNLRAKLTALADEALNHPSGWLETVDAQTRTLMFHWINDQFRGSDDEA